MKTKELKTVIRSMVRECVYELLAEKFIEKQLDEHVGKKAAPRIVENAPVPQEKSTTKAKQPIISRDEMIRRYGLEQDSSMRNLFEDTLSNNPMCNGEGYDPPGTISENALEKSGIMRKDWSKYF